MTVLPGAVWGPPLSGRSDSESVRQMMRLMRGAGRALSALIVTLRDSTFGFVSAL